MKNVGRAGGFTLVELILGLFVGALLMSAAYFMMISGHKSSTGIERKVAAQQDVRAALDIMAMEIGMASYNPTFALGIWVQGPSSPPNVTTNCILAGNQSYRGIQTATPMALTVEMDIVENGSIKITDANEIISYTYDPTSQTILRGVNCGTANPFLGGGVGAVAGTKTVNLINTTAPINNGNGTPAIFRYYNSTGGELYPDTNPSDIPNIRRIDIILAVQTEQQDPSTNAFRSMIYSTSILVRNHAIN